MSIRTVLVIAFALNSPVAAQQTFCGTSQIVAPEADVAHWTVSHKIFVAPDFRREIIDQYCTDALQLLAASSAPASPDRLVVTAAAVNGVRNDAINDYLNNYADLSSVARSMRAVLRSHLGVQGFSRPVPRTRGIVQFKYHSAIDLLQIRGQTFDPWPSFLMLPGPAAFVGSAAGHIVCRGTVTVNIAAPAVVTC